MSEVTKPSNIGRPPVTEAKEQRVLDLLEDEKTPLEIMQDTGLSQTKVYEIRRVWLRAKATRQSLISDQSA